MKNLIAAAIAVCFAITAKAQKPVADTAFTIIPAPQQTWGYEITANKKVFIHQTSIPGMPGNGGFTTKKDAEKTARLVLQKLHKGIMPPSITAAELKQLNINLNKQ